MQFLWSLLPGAREARNHVIIGYAWLAAIGLWLGVPEVPTEGNLHELVTAIGPVGVGLAVSFGAFMIGSLFDDLVSLVFKVRPARPFTSGEEGGLKILDALGDAGRSELERLEASIDRSSSEVTLRVGLLEALIVAAVAVQRHDFQLWWLIGFVAVAGALAFQIRRRQRALYGDLKSSNILRSQAVERAKTPFTATG